MQSGSGLVTCGAPELLLGGRGRGPAVVSLGYRRFLKRCRYVTPILWRPSPAVGFGVGSAGRTATGTSSATLLQVRRVVFAAVVAFAAGILAGCGGGTLGDGSLGVVEVEAGQAVRVQLLGRADSSSPRAAALAVADYGSVHGFPVQTEGLIDPECTAAGGQAAAEAITGPQGAGPRVAGVVGPTCSPSAVGANPVLAAAGLTVISPSATAPLLTSNLQGAPGPDWRPGFYRTAHNDLYQAEAAARFLLEERGITTAATAHSGRAYTRGLAESFADAYQQQGGTLTALVEVAEDGSDTAAVLARLAAGRPGALYLPLRPDAAAPIARHATNTPGLEQALRVGADALLSDSFLGLPESEGIYYTGPAPLELANTNQGTNRTGSQVLDAYQAAYGAVPDGPWWGYGYDAAAILLDAITAASRVKDGTLRIDLAGVREYLDSLDDYQGLTGRLGCDSYGDCGTQRIAIIEHLDHQNVPAGRANVVYQTSP